MFRVRKLFLRAKLFFGAQASLDYHLLCSANLTKSAKVWAWSKNGLILGLQHYLVPLNLYTLESGNLGEPVFSLLSYS